MHHWNKFQGLDFSDLDLIFKTSTGQIVTYVGRDLIFFFFFFLKSISNFLLFS